MLFVRPRTKESIRQAARKDGVNMNQFIRQAIAEALTRRGIECGPDEVNLGTSTTAYEEGDE